MQRAQLMLIDGQPLSCEKLSAVLIKKYNKLIVQLQIAAGPFEMLSFE